MSSSPCRCALIPDGRRLPRRREHAAVDPVVREAFGGRGRAIRDRDDDVACFMGKGAGPLCTRRSCSAPSMTSLRTCRTGLGHGCVTVCRAPAPGSDRDASNSCTPASSVPDDVVIRPAGETGDVPWRLPGGHRMPCSRQPSSPDTLTARTDAGDPFRACCGHAGRSSPCRFATRRLTGSPTRCAPAAPPVAALGTCDRDRACLRPSWFTGVPVSVAVAGASGLTRHAFRDIRAAHLACRPAARPRRIAQGSGVTVHPPSGMRTASRASRARAASCRLASGMPLKRPPCALGADGLETSCRAATESAADGQELHSSGAAIGAG